MVQKQLHSSAIKSWSKLINKRLWHFPFELTRSCEVTGSLKFSRNVDGERRFLFVSPFLEQLRLRTCVTIGRNARSENDSFDSLNRRWNPVVNVTSVRTLRRSRKEFDFRFRDFVFRREDEPLLLRKIFHSETLDDDVHADARLCGEGVQLDDLFGVERRGLAVRLGLDGLQVDEFSRTSCVMMHLDRIAAQASRCPSHRRRAKEEGGARFAGSGLGHQSRRRSRLDDESWNYKRKVKFEIALKTKNSSNFTGHICKYLKSNLIVCIIKYFLKKQYMQLTWFHS